MEAVANGRDQEDFMRKAGGLKHELVALIQVGLEKSDNEQRNGDRFLLLRNFLAHTVGEWDHG